MAAAFDQSAPPTKHWTYDDLQCFDETERYEIYDGKLISLSPAPSFFHQQILGSLHFLIASFLREHPLGEAVFAPLDVVFAPDNVAQPDLLFIANENACIIKEHIFGAPDLAVEILSPWSIRRDRYDKLEQYARFGVKEYWIIDPANRSIEVLALREDTYVLHGSAAQTGTVSSIVLASFGIEISQLF